MGAFPLDARTLERSRLRGVSQLARAVLRFYFTLRARIACLGSRPANARIRGLVERSSDRSFVASIRLEFFTKKKQPTRITASWKIVAKNAKIRLSRRFCAVERRTGILTFHFPCRLSRVPTLPLNFVRNSRTVSRHKYPKCNY